MKEQDLIIRLKRMDELTSQFGECLQQMSVLVPALGKEISQWVEIVRDQYNTIEILSGSLEDERVARIRAENALHNQE